MSTGSREASLRKSAQRTVRSAALVVAGLLLGSWPGLAGQEPMDPQARARRPKLHHVPRATSAIEIDGALDERAWADALSIRLELEWFPGDNARPPVETVAYVAYDDRQIYFGFRCLDPQPAKIRAHLMDRDQIDTFVQDDHVLIMLDTFNDERRAFQFRANPLGVQADAIFSEVDGLEDFSWDMIWSSRGRITAEGWELEIALPVNQLRFQKTAAAQTWGVELGRSWPRSSRHRINDSGRDRDRACILCQFDKMTGFEGLEPGRNLEFDPTLTGVRTDALDEFPDGELQEAELQEGDEDGEAGLTARWGVTPNVTLVGTLNPDFSQIEADVAQLDVNERFALFFEEKRPFFLEGIDFFSTPIDAVFTRTVVDPDWGVKLTGKQARNAIGVFAAEDDVNSLILPANQSSQSTLLDETVTSGIFRYRRDLGAASTLGALYSGREADGYHNRVGGLDGFVRLSARDTLTFHYLRSDTLYPGAVAEEFEQPTAAFADDALFVEYKHGSRNWYGEVSYEDLGPGFRADSGFLPRVDIREGSGLLIRSFWGKEADWYDRWRVGAVGGRTEDHAGQLTDEELSLIVDVNGPLQSFVQVEFKRGRQFFEGVLYDDLDGVGLYGEFQPLGAVRFEMYVADGDTVDFINNRKAEERFLNPIVEARLGRHVNLRLDHTLQRLEVPAGELFEANLTQLRLVYNFSVRMFVRAIFQRLDLERDPGLFIEPVEPEDETLFTQLLFSYKLNARTVLFVGYSDNHLGLQGVDLTRTDRTFFVKLGYAWVL